MGEILVVEYPKSRNNQAGNDLTDLIHNQNEQGWHFGWGDPEMWNFSERLLVPNGKVLDLGIAMGRSSMFFALHGMEVLGYDNSKRWVNRLNKMAKAFKLPIRAKYADLTEIDLGTNLYDVVVLNQILYHLPGERAAWEILDKAWAATKPSGYLWVRTTGREDKKFEFYSSLADEHPDLCLDDSTFMDMCICGGSVRMEPHSYLDQLLLLKYFSNKGAKILRSQTIPQFGRPNVMYGEDWFNEEAKYRLNGVISILAQKR